MSGDDRPRIATAHEQLGKAAYLTELACESLSPVAGLCEQWERLRTLMHMLRDERDQLARYLEEKGP